jgi:predicted Zn-dependent protease
VRARLPTVVLLLATLLGSACGSPASREDLPSVQPGERPALSTDEAGLWMEMDRVEKEVRTSGRLVTDPALNAYVRGVVCKVAAEYCRDLRVYVMQIPEFNASMAPNGFMVVLTGLLLRSRDEAQLAYVLAHEVSHYERRHTLQRWRNVRAVSNVAILGQVSGVLVGIAPISVIPVAMILGPVVTATTGSVFAFSRDQEREADALGLERMVKAGYDPRAAPAVWSQLAGETNAANKEGPSLFFATHPSGEERLATLRERAETVNAGGFTGEAELRAATLPFRGAWLRDELRSRDFARFQALLDQLKASNANLGELRYFQAELYRLRAAAGDEQRAIDAYRGALVEIGAPPDVHRGLGDVYRRLGDVPQARAAYADYLRLSPEAPERAMIEAYLQAGE